MCGRFCIASSPGELSERFNIRVPDSYHPRYNIAPSEKVLVIRDQKGEREAVMAEWGFLSSGMTRVINARVESLDKRLLFKELKKGRCLVPASGYYKWKKVSDRKVPFYIFSKNAGDTQLCATGKTDEKKIFMEGVMTFAGLIRGTGNDLQLVIITREAYPQLAHIHERMPFILKPDCEIDYLNGDEISSLAIWEEEMSMYEVSTKVNSPGFDGPDLMKPFNNLKAQIRLFEG